MSALPFELFLASRYLRPKRTFVSVITLISVMGVTLGVGVLIIVISVMTGFDVQLREKLLGFNSHMKIERADAPMANWELILNAVRTNQNIKGVAPYVLGRVMVETQPTVGSQRIEAPLVRGIEPSFETNVTVLTPDSLVAGEFNLERNGLLVGNQLAMSLHLRVGDRLLVVSPESIREMRDKQGTKEEIASLGDEYVVNGIFRVGYYEFDASVIVTALENAQDLYRLEQTDAVHGLLIMLHDPFKANQVRSELHQLLGVNYHISLWTEENSEILNALVVEKKVMFIVLFFIMIVAAFGIMNSLITFVVQKTREIGMLKALGATCAQIIWLFLSQGLMVGVVGVSSGFGMGMLLLRFRNEFLHLMKQWTGMELFPASIYFFTDLPAKIVPGDILLICGSALVICIFAALIPAAIAGRLRPVEALRHE